MNRGLLLGIVIVVFMLGIVLLWRMSGDPTPAVVSGHIESVADHVERADRQVRERKNREAVEGGIELSEFLSGRLGNDPPALADSSIRVLLEVKVLSEGGRPLKGVEVGSRTRAFPFEDSKTTKARDTDEEGIARLQVLPGRVSVHAFDERNPISMASSEIFCVGSGPFFLELVLAPTASVRGRVFDETSGAGIPNARVIGPGTKRYGRLPAVTDERGEFELRAWPVDVMAGVEVRAEGFGMEQVKLSVTSDGNWEVPARFGWEKQAGNGGVPWVEVGLVLEKTIVGTIVDSSGSAVPGARVEAIGRFLTKARMAHRDRMDFTTGADGAFELSGLRSDITHSVRVRVEGHLQASLLSLPTVYTDLFEIVLEPAYVVSGVVIDTTGRAVPGLRVECVSIEQEVPHSAWDPEGGSRRDRDGYSGHFPSVVTGFTTTDGSFRIEGARTSELELRFGVVRRPVLKQSLVRPTNGDLNCGQIVLEEGFSIIDCDVQLQSDLSISRAEAVLASPGGDVFSRVPCSSSGQFQTWWPIRQRVADVLIFDLDRGELLLELRGVATHALQTVR